ncbi:MAG: response regulator [Clostridia bacterium]|nr:response regulator [Clostridia bacterium]
MTENRKAPRQKILIVDDSELNRSILADMLGGDFDVIEASNGREAVELISLYGGKLSLVLLDIVMPQMDGFEVLAKMKEKKWIQDIPVIIISSENTSQFIERAYELGATDYIQRPFDTNVVRRRSLNTIMLYGKQKELKGLIEESVYRREREQSLMINILSHIIEFRDGDSGNHITNVRKVSEMLLNTLAKYNAKYLLPQYEISLIALASALHDIGKITLDADYLNKPEKLGKKELETVRAHSLRGAEMIKKLPYASNEPLVQRAYEICRWHHERWDGSGYPDGLTGDEIPVSAQVVGLADAYDTLTNKRVYKEAVPHSKAVEMILNGECGAFNPDLLEAFKSVAGTLQTNLRLSSLEDI